MPNSRMEAATPRTASARRSQLLLLLSFSSGLLQLGVELVEDRPGVFYQSTCAMAPPPSARRLARAMLSPWRAISSTLFTTLYGITSRVDEHYPCNGVDPAADAALRAALVAEAAPVAVAA